MNERSKSDLLFEEDEEFIDALEEAVEALSKKCIQDPEPLKTETINGTVYITNLIENIEVI